VTLTNEIQPRDLFVIRKVKVRSQAQTDRTVSVGVSNSESHLSRQFCAKSWRFDFDAKNRLQLIQNLMAHEGRAKCLK
jgi:propanediol utilization protein